MQIKILSSTAVIDEETALVHIKEQVAVDNVASENSLVYGILLSGDIFVSAKLNDTTFTIDRLHILADLLLNARIDDTLEFIIIREGISHTESVIITEQSINVIE